MYRNPFGGIPGFCSHEHWGSFAALGHGHGAFRADLAWGVTPARTVTVVDLLLDPYLGGRMAAGGFDANASAASRGFADVYEMAVTDPAEAFRTLREPLRRLRLTGAYQALRRGFILLYGVDISRCTLGEWVTLDRAVGKNYARMFAWYRRAMEEAGLSRLIRLMWPELYLYRPDSEDAVEERSFTDTIMRVDAFMELWRDDYPRRAALIDVGGGVNPVGRDSTEAFLAETFRRAEAGGCLGSKQAQAYSRNLDFPDVYPERVRWSGERSPEDVKTWQDWVMNACLRETATRGWPHHCHVGTHNLPHSSPLPLGAVAARYPGVKLVMLHCHPYVHEAGFLAMRNPNVYIDACWQVILNPDFLRTALRAWLGYLPLNKITIGHDATSVEMAVGACSMVREILHEVLTDRSSLLGLRRKDIPGVAADLLHNNAVDLYGIGERVEI